MLEARDSDSQASIEKAGRFQTGVRGLEAHVKDSRFPDGWAFFGFKATDASAEPIPGERVAGGVECYTKDAAVEPTFVQFSPTLREIAPQKGTLNRGFLPTSDSTAHTDAAGNSHSVEHRGSGPSW